jgi:hypothetical protein
MEDDSSSSSTEKREEGTTAAYSQTSSSLEIRGCSVSSFSLYVLSKGHAAELPLLWGRVSQIMWGKIQYVRLLSVVCAGWFCRWWLTITVAFVPVSRRAMVVSDFRLFCILYFAFIRHPFLSTRRALGSQQETVHRMGYRKRALSHIRWNIR